MRKQFANSPVIGQEIPPSSVINSKEQNRIIRYDSEIIYVDHHLGSLLKILDQIGIRNSTLVVMTSDHGESLGKHDYVRHDRHLYKAILQVPLIMRFPKKIFPSRVIKTPVSLLDVAPTILELTRLTNQIPPIPTTFSGRSLSGAIQDGEVLAPHSIRFFTFPVKKGRTPTGLSLFIGLRPSTLPLRMG